MPERNGQNAANGKPWVGIAANANSGLGAGKRRVERLVAELHRRGLGVRLSWTPQERQALVAEARPERHCQCLVAVGGDGTVAALVNDRPAVPITVLKAGTENLFAGHFGLSAKPARVAETIAYGRVVRLDAGQTAGRLFTLMAGFGFDADVVSRHHVARTGRAGVARRTHRGAYVEPVLRSSFAYRFPPLTIRIDDPGQQEELVGTTAFVFNLPRYALGLPFAPAAVGNDGWLDLVVFRNAGPWNALRYLWMVVRGVHVGRDDVYHRRVGRVTIASAEAVPVQLDGDPGGRVEGGMSAAPWSIEVMPLAFDVLVPSSHSAREALTNGQA